MNRIIYTADECLDSGIRLTGQRAEHIRTILHATPGKPLKVGLLNGAIGIATVRSIESNGTVWLEKPNDSAPSLRPWFDLILALPRPRAVKRLLPQLATMGVRKLHLVRAAKVPKSYFDSPCLKPDSIQTLFIEGLMQAGTTILPECTISLAPFTPEDYPSDGLRLLCHPGHPKPLPPPREEHLPLLAIGPDGGWTNEEIDRFHTAGFIDFSLGSRPLRTDTACIALTAVLQDRLLQGVPRENHL
ncbi:MAG: RsmE family RNA methyltransferase [Kiritimatiellia bacterium]|nr:RsmE family RNA methyltransferase [Kiritimatiellia bacterium]